MLGGRGRNPRSDHADQLLAEGGKMGGVHINNMSATIKEFSYIILEIPLDIVKLMKERIKELNEKIPDILILLKQTTYGVKDNTAYFIFKSRPIELETEEGLRVYPVEDLNQLDIEYRNRNSIADISHETIKRFINTLGLKIKTKDMGKQEESVDISTLFDSITIGTIDKVKEIGIEEGEILDQLRKYRKKRDKLIKVLYNYFRDKYYLVTTDTWDLYCYDENEKIYVVCDKKIINEMKFLGEVAEVEEYITRYVMKEVLEGLKAVSYKPWKELEHSKWYIVTKNGYIINMYKWGNEGRLEIYQPSPQIFVTTKINANLDLEKFKEVLDKIKNGEIKDWLSLGEQLCPRIHKAFIDWVGHENVRVLYEIIGYTLYPEYVMGISFMLVGDGANGKSTYLKVIKTFLGKNNVSHVSLQELTENRFSRVELVGKLANIFPDLPSKPLKYSGIFKALTGRDIIYIDIKHRKGFNYENYAKLIFSANELPKVNDMTLAFWRRWVIVEFPNRFPNNPNFFRELISQEELDGLLIMSLLALREVIVKRDFSIKGDFKEKWLRMTNSVYAFMQDLKNGKIEGYRYIEDPNRRIESSKLYDIYVEYCRKEDYNPLNKREFTIEMQRLGFKRKKITGYYYWVGFTVREESTQELEDYWSYGEPP